MRQNNSIIKALPVLFGFFVMGFCDIVGISSDYAQEAFGWSNTMTGFIPSMVFVWFLFLSIPVGIQMNKWGRKNTVLLSMAITVVGMIIPLISYNSVTCMAAYALLGIGNAILQVSVNPLLSNVITDKKLLTSSLTAGQVVKAISSLVGPYIVLIGVNYFGKGDTALWYYCFPILGGITLVSALWLFFTPIEREARLEELAAATQANDSFISAGSLEPTASSQQTSSASSSASSLSATFALLKNRTLLLLFLGIFFVVGVDVATNFISSKLMIERFGWTKEEAGLAPQIYFFSRTVGALLGVFLMTKIEEMRYFKLNIVVCIAVLIGLAFVEAALFNLVCIGAVGFLCSCIFPIIYSMAVQARPDKANLISGLMITAVSGGGAVTPLIGIATDSVGMIGGVFVILCCVLYLTYCAFGVKIAR